MEELLYFLGEPWNDALLKHNTIKSRFRDPLMFPSSREAVGPIASDTVGRWQRDLTAEDKQCFKAIAGNLLIELGYASNNDW
jgi:hypothetical protein